MTEEGGKNKVRQIIIFPLLEIQEAVNYTSDAHYQTFHQGKYGSSNHTRPISSRPW